MLRQMQDLFYGSRFSNIELGNGVDMVAVGRGFGISADRISVEKPEAGIEQMSKTDGPYLLEVMVDPEDYVFPIIPPGRSNMEMIYGKPE